MTIAIAQTLDLKGLACPLPIVKTAKALRDLRSGDLVEVFATDRGSLKDFPAWSRATGNEILESGQTGDTFRFVIRKR